MNKKVLTLCAGFLLAGSAVAWGQTLYDVSGGAKTSGDTYYKIAQAPSAFNQFYQDKSSMTGKSAFPNVSPFAIKKVNGAKPIQALENAGTDKAENKYFQFVVSENAAKHVLTMVFVDGHYQVQIENVENANFSDNPIKLDRTLWKVTAHKDAAGTTLYYELQNKATDAILQLATTPISEANANGFAEVSLNIVAGQTDWRWAKGETASVVSTVDNSGSTNAEKVVLVDELSAQFSNGTTLYLAQKTVGNKISLGAIVGNSNTPFTSETITYTGGSTAIFKFIKFEAWEANPILLTAEQINAELGNDLYDDGKSDGQFHFTFAPDVVGNTNVMNAYNFVAEEAKTANTRKPGDAADGFVRFYNKADKNQYLMVDTTYYNEEAQDRYELKMAVQEITFPRHAVIEDKLDIADVQSLESAGTAYTDVRGGRSYTTNPLYSVAAYTQMKRQSNFLPVFYPATSSLRLQAEMIYKKSKTNEPWWKQVKEDINNTGAIRVSTYASTNGNPLSSSNVSWNGSNKSFVNATGYYPAYNAVNGTALNNQKLAYQEQYVIPSVSNRQDNGYELLGEKATANNKWSAVATLNVKANNTVASVLLNSAPGMYVIDPTSAATQTSNARLGNTKLIFSNLYLTSNSNVVKLVTLSSNEKFLTTDIADPNDKTYNGLLTIISLDGLRQNSNLTEVIDIPEGFYYIQNANESSTQLAKVGDYRYEDLAATNAMFTYWNQTDEKWDRGVTAENGAVPTATTSSKTTLGDVIKVNTGLNADQHKNDKASKGNLIYSSEKLTIPSAQWYITGNGTNYVMINRESGRQWNTEYWWKKAGTEDVYVNQATYTDAAGQLQTYRDTIRITPVPRAELTNPYLGYLNLSQKEVQNDTTTFAIGMTSMGDIKFSLVEEDGVLKMKQDADGKYKLERVVTKDVDTYVSAGDHFTDDLIYGYVPMLSANEADTAKMLTRAKYYIYKDDVSANTGLDEDGKGVCLRDYIVLENGQYKTKKIEVKFETVKSDEGDILYSINRESGVDEYTDPNNTSARRAFYIKQMTPNANEYVLVDPYVVSTTDNNTTGQATYGARVFVNQQTTELQPGSLVSNGYANSYANSILTIAPESAQNYFDIRREGADLDTVKIFVANNPSYLLGENSNVKGAEVGLLELREVSDDICNALFVDTANMSNAACPRFLLGVRDTKKFEESNLDHHHNRHLYTQAAYLVNLKDSTERVYKYNNAGVNVREYYRLGFLNGTHYAYGEYKNLPGSYLVMEDGKEFNLTNLGETGFDLPVFAFRYCDATRENFYIETTYDGSKKGWIEIHNGVAVVTDDIQAAEVFSYEATEETATANESIAAENNAVSVVATDGAVIVKGAEGKNVVIATILGKVVANETVNSDNETIAVPAGIAVVSVDGESFKVVVK